MRRTQALADRAGAAAVAAALLAMACGTPDSVSESGPVRVGVVAPKESGPRGQAVGVGYLTAVLVRETLVSIGPRGTFEPRLAERWERSEDGTRWRFFLRKDVLMHDGTKLTSGPVLAALRNPRGGLSSFAGVARIEAVDETTFDIVQDRASSLLLDALAAVSIGTGTGNTIGTGPFKATPGGGAEAAFSAFEKHHRGAPSIAQVGLRQYTDQRNAWASLMRGEIDVLYEVSAEAREFVETETTVNVSTFVRPYTYLLAFNLGNSTFREKQVRRAFNLAIDRGEVIRTALRGHAEPAYDHLWPRHWAVDPSRSSAAPDRAAALRLMEAAGLTKLVQRKPGGMPSRLSFTCLVYEPLEKFALAIQRQLALIDVDMSVVLLPVQALAQRIGTGDYEAFLFELANARVLGYTYAFWHSQSPESVRTGYSGADGALDRMRYARTDADVRAAVRDVQDAMRDDPPAVFLAYPEVARAVSTKFEIPSGEEDIFHTIARWKPTRRGN